MQLEYKKLWNRDFILLVFGQTVSIFGNMILSFVLPLYILDISGSASLFGLVMALPYISLIMMSPVGGIIADRLRKQRIMFWLDLSTTLIILLYIAINGLFASAVAIVIVKLMALNAIQGLYMPAVQSSVPVLVPSDKLVPANAVVTMVNTFSSMAGMAIAGILYASFGLFPILAVSVICFAITAVMDLLIRIPYTKQSTHENLVQLVKNDIILSVRYIVKEKPSLAKTAIIIFLVQVSILPLLIVGIPVLITQNLELGMDLVGISQSIMMAGGFVGAIIASTFGAKLTIKNTYLLLLIGSIAIIPAGIVFLFETTPFTSYIIITAASALTLGVIQIAGIQIMAFVQGVTPTELTGKVMSLLVILPFVANGLGSLIYGVLFEHFEKQPWVVVFVTVIVSVIVAVNTGKIYAKTSEDEKIV